MKDVFKAITDPSGWLGSKEGPLLSLGQEAITGKDWRGDPIAPHRNPGETLGSYAPKWVGSVLKEIGGSYVPIPLGVEQSKSPLSNLSATETFLGARGAGMQYTNPDVLKRMQVTADTLKQVETAVHSINATDAPGDRRRLPTRKRSGVPIDRAFAIADTRLPTRP